MKLTTLLLFPLILACLTAQAADGQSGNGGGGVNRNGRYMTFYSAGFYTEPNEATTDEVPQLPELLNFFNTTPYVSAMTKAKYASQLVPSSSRSYFKVQPGTFTPEIRARLLAEYSRVMKIDTSELALFAITDTNSRTTYLFPEFYGLRPAEQQAILFHEIFWLVNPDATYPEVIQAEMAFQAYLEYPSSTERLLRWLKTSGTNGDMLTAAIKSDLQSKAMGNFVKQNRFINLNNLFGAQFIDCKIREIGAECVPFLSLNAYALTQKFPKSLFLKLYYESVSKGATTLKFSSANDNYLAIVGWRPKDFWSDLATRDIDLLVAGYSSSSKFIVERPKGYNESIVLDLNSN